MNLLAEAVGLLLPGLPLAALYLAVRHGPFRHRWWGGENALGFAAVVGGFSFAAGFFGPILFAPEADQGPLLGIFITGPMGFLVGLAWGLLRAAKRRRALRADGSGAG